MYRRTMARITATLSAAALAVVITFGGGCTRPVGPKATFYVGPNGNDVWSGKLPGPNRDWTDGAFATLHRARDAVRELKADGRHAGPIVVMIRKGCYYLDRPLQLGPADSGTADRPVIYTAYPNERVILSGGWPITGWRPTDQPYWTADLADPNWTFRQLFADGERQIRARTPNFDPEKPRTGGWSFVLPFKQKASGGFGTTLVKIHTPGDTFQWRVHVPADGRYALWFYYGARNEPHGRKNMAGRTTMRVDGGKPVILRNLPDTGGWHIRKWSKTATLDLSKGQHRLRWTNVKGGGLDFDAFALASRPDYTPKGTKPAKPTDGGHLILVQAEAYETVRAREFAVVGAKAPQYKNRFMFRPGDIKRWPRSPRPEIHIFPAWGWVNAILSVAGIDHDRNVCHVTNRNCSQELRPGNRYFVANVLEELDTPGEWFLDDEHGWLYYWPRDKNFAKKGMIAPVLDRLIEIGGPGRPGDLGGLGGPSGPGGPGEASPVEYVVFRGLTFRHTKYSLEMPSVYSPGDGVIHMAGANHCVIEDCRFLGIGGYAVRMSGRSSHNAVLGNTITQAGQGGVLIVGESSDNQPTANIVSGNRMHDLGKIWKHVAGVYVTTGSGNRITHNTITDVPRYAISLKSFRKGVASHDNIVEYNRILRTNTETNDTGAIETLGRDREDSGNVISHNLLLDAIGLKTSPTGEMWTPFYSWGIYLDDYSSGTRVRGNIVARNYRGGIHVHLGRNNVFENNILIDGRNQQAEFNGAEFMANNTFVRNIVSCRSGNLIRISRYHDKVLTACDSNVYWQIGADLNDPARGVTPTGSLAKWRQAGYDQRSVVADPLFVDPANDDYRLRPESPALELGFVPTDMGKIGVRGYRRPSHLP